METPELAPQGVFSALAFFVQRGTVKVCFLTTDSMKELLLTGSLGGFSLVDDEDYERLIGYTWCHFAYRSLHYAKRNIRTATGGNTTQLLHRAVMQLPPSRPYVDHIDGDGLNNQKSNLRIATNSQNMSNRRKLTPTSSRFKGVGWHKRTGMWVARVRILGVQKHLGLFESEVDAARAYNEAALKSYGEFARINELPSELERAA